MENYACVPGEKLMFSVVATEPAEVLFLSTECMFTMCPHACGFHNKLIHNTLTIAPRRNPSLSWRIMNTSAKSIRGRMLSSCPSLYRSPLVYAEMRYISISSLTLV